MSAQENVQTVKDFFAAVGRGDTQGLPALSVEDIEWNIPGETWPLAVRTAARARRMPNRKGDPDARQVEAI
jgi:ketosteroid isomerase-like protein